MLAQQVKTQHPLLIPDILLHLLEWFDSETLKRSLQVCHLWHNLFVPRFWRRIDYQPGLPPVQAFQKHAVHVHEINCESEHAVSALAQTGIVFPNLKTLLLHHRSDYDDYEIKEDSIALLQRHSNAPLKWLRIDAVESEQLLDAIAGVSTLEHLSISHLLVTPKKLIAWHENLSRLRVLHLQTFGVDFGEYRSADGNDESADSDDESADGDDKSADSDDESADGDYESADSDDDSAHGFDESTIQVFEVLQERLQTVQTQLEEIDIEGDEEGLLVATIHNSIIQNSPRLKRLKWSFAETLEYAEDHVFQGPMAFLNNAVLLAGKQQQQPLRALQSLESLAIPATVFTKDEFVVVLGALPALEELNLLRTNFDQDAWQALRNHAPRYLNTLKVLNIQCCEFLNPSVVQDILCSATGLETLRADYINDRSLVTDPRPWVCTGLKILEMEIVVKDLANGPMILSRLGALTQLEELRLNGIMNLFYYNAQDLRASGYYSNAQLHFTLEHGLDQMRQLSKLKVFQGPTRSAECLPWGTAEARWVLQHWVQMKNLSVKVDQEASNLLKPILSRDYGIVQ
ncbi:hypothetical protein BGZ83_008565 [Gryganskiella cystojenkinii]|nr:hypothetical protein BGZ83_008565 [Gryganskiella cystojenkinii]